MFSKYFEELGKALLKTAATAKKGKGPKGKAAADKKAVPDISSLMKNLDGLIPSHTRVDSVKIIDPSGYSPEGIDFVVYRELYRGIREMMGGYIPLELVHGTFVVTAELNKDTVVDVLNRVIQAKKTGRFTETKEETGLVPSFVISYGSNMDLAQLKNAIVDFYVSRGIEHFLECDIMLILNKGLVVKNWREKRSFLALETGRDSLMWFFILMNEYLDANKAIDFDLRSYVQHTEKYREY
jgi:hypothetical protein